MKAIQPGLFDAPFEHLPLRDVRIAMWSLSFAAGDNRKVAVKIVDDRGIESLKIVDLD